jgi:hypothetical protein
VKPPYRVAGALCGFANGSYIGRMTGSGVADFALELVQFPELAATEVQVRPEG